MTDREIIQYIDSGANYYVSLFGNAPHMRKTDKVKLFGKIAPYIDMNSCFAKIQKMAENVQDIMGLYALHNSDTYIHFDHGIYLDINKINLGKYEGSQLVLQWYERNLKIFSNLQNVYDKGDRVLVLIGSSHLKILKESITASNELELGERI